MNNLTSHRDALAAFENNDPLASLHNKIAKFHKKEKKKGQTRDNKYEWISTQRRLKEQEDELSQQILRSSQSILELMQNEKNNDKENVNPTSLSAISSMQDIVSGMQRRTAYSTDTTLEELETIYTKLSKDNTEHRREVMQLLRESDSPHAQLSQSITTVIDSLRTLVQDKQYIEDTGDVDMLENELRSSLANAQQQYDSTLQQLTSQKMNKPKKWDEKSLLIFKKALASSSSGPNANKLFVKRLTRNLPSKSAIEIIEYLDYYKRKKIQKQKAEAAAQDLRNKCQTIEEKGLKEIDRLRKEYTTKYEQYKDKNDIELKSKEMNIKLKSLRLKQDERQQSKVEQQEQAAAQKAQDEHKRKALLIYRHTVAKQSISKHQAQQIRQQEEANANELRDDFINELDNLQQKKTNRERSEFRQEQIELREINQQEADMEALREEELRLSRLNTLASSTPYYNNIMNKEADIHKTTFARKQDFFRRSQLPDHQSGNLKSFTTDRVFSDSKFRLSNALHEAGVSNTAYARDVIRQAIPRAEERTTGIQPY